MRRMFSFFLMVLTITASFSPCCKEELCCEQEIVADNTEEKDGAADNCSPFITCGNCVGFSQMTTTLEIPLFRTQKLFHYTRIILVNSSTYQLPLFQPPRGIFV